VNVSTKGIFFSVFFGNTTESISEVFVKASDVFAPNISTVIILSVHASARFIGQKESTSCKL
jgi:hypothetical protein